MTALPLQIDRLTRDEVPATAAMVALLPFFKAYGYDRVRIEQWLLAEVDHARCELLAASSEGTLVGLAWFVPRGGFDRSGYLKLLAVAESTQRQGVGRRLMQVLEERFLGQEGISLLVTEDNLPARAFYERLGYQMVGKLPGYVRPDRTECIYHKNAVK